MWLISGWGEIQADPLCRVRKGQLSCRSPPSSFSLSSWAVALSHAGLGVGWRRHSEAVLFIFVQLFSGFSSQCVAEVFKVDSRAVPGSCSVDSCLIAGLCWGTEARVSYLAVLVMSLDSWVQEFSYQFCL